MGKLIIEGNSVYEIDEECVRHKRLPKECGVEEKLREAQEAEQVAGQVEERKENRCKMQKYVV